MAVAAALCSMAVVFAVYSPTLNFKFVLDDHRFTGDPRIQFPDHVWDYFANYVWAQFTGGPPSFYRPLFLSWLRMNFIVSAMSPWGWHALSIAKHLAVAVSLGLPLPEVTARSRCRVNRRGAHPRCIRHRPNPWPGYVPDPFMSAALWGCNSHTSGGHRSLLLLCQATEETRARLPGLGRPLNLNCTG